jgi:hypothetical protein
MGRINALVALMFADIDQLRPTGLFQTGGVRADLLRAIVVFLHATFEDLLRSHVPKPDKKVTIYSGVDIDKVLRRSGIDAGPFRALYPPLAQLAKRRKRIVHEADLSNLTDTETQAWGVVDDWQLALWLMAVPAFYYQLRMSVGVASATDTIRYERLRRAMVSHGDVANQFLAFLEVPPELQRDAVLKIAATMEAITAALRADVSELTTA